LSEKAPAKANNNPRTAGMSAVGDCAPVIK
jgi:hypothetical protein